MNYIGSKNKLSKFIKNTIYQKCGQNLSDKIFCDIFAGTGIVGRNFKNEVKYVISNDIEYYSYILNQNYIGNYKNIENKNKYLEKLNNIKPVKGFIFNNYCSEISGRQYFSIENGQKIDAIRIKIQEWFDHNKIDLNIYYYLLTSLLENADKVANTASVYGAYLKHLKKSAQKPLILKPVEFQITKNKHFVYNQDSNILINNIEGDILYLDPPYNARQYGSNYHILNTIALYDNFKPKGKTGLRDYNKSKYCSKTYVKDIFEELIKNAKFEYVFLSYNNEGLMSFDFIKDIFKKYGKYEFVAKEYQRFKANNNIINGINKTTEYIHILHKNL